MFNSAKYNGKLEKYMIKTDYLVKLHSKYFFLCLQALVSSLRLFSDDNIGLCMIKYFSSRHRLHILLEVE